MLTIGPYKIHVIETCPFWADGGAMFGSVPKVLWNKACPADRRNRIQLAARALLLIGAGRSILIDTGVGAKLAPKQRQIFKLRTSHPDLTKLLRSIGLTVADITDVILTHLHFDHAGGATIVENGRLVPTFPTAKYYVQREHWRYAENPTEKDRAGFINEDFLPLQEHGVLTLLDGDSSIFPKLSFVIANGHTTALQLPKITDGKNTLFFSGDLLPTVSHIPLSYIMGYDLRPLVTLAEKKKVLAQAYEENWTIFFEHDPTTLTAKIKLTDKGFRVDPDTRVANKSTRE